MQTNTSTALLPTGHRNLRLIVQEIAKAMKGRCRSVRENPRGGGIGKPRLGQLRRIEGQPRGAQGGALIYRSRDRVDSPAEPFDHTRVREARELQPSDALGCSLGCGEQAPLAGRQF